MTAGNLTFRVASERLAPVGARVVIIAMALAAIAVLSAQPLWASASALALVTVLAMMVDKSLVIPIIIVAIPLEFSKEHLPSIYDDSSTPTIRESILDAGRLAILAAAVLWVARARPSCYRDLPRSGLYLPIALLTGLFALSAVYSEDLEGGVRSFLRLVVNLSLFTLVLLYVRDRTTLDRSLLALVGIGLVLAFIGLYQQATDTYFINESLAERFDFPRRNATFFDPNIYARFLVVVCAVALGMLTSARPRVRYLLIGTVAIALLALPFTSSRSGWVTAALVLPLVIALIPMNKQRRIRMIAIAAIGAVLLAYLVALLEPSLIERFQTLSSKTETLAVRSYLIRAGWQMFLDNPLFGVGLAGFREALEGPYSRFLPSDATSLLSHTTVVTVIAELGLLGLGVLALLIYRFSRLNWSIYTRGSAGDRALVAGFVGASLAIFLSSQSEGRFYEEPFLWLLLGLTVALADIGRREAQIGLARDHPVEQ